MIVVYPNRVVGFDQVRQLVGEFRAHAAVCGKRFAIEVEQVQAIVKQRPQHAVGETGVVAFVIFASQIERCVANWIDRILVHVEAWLLRHFAAPAEPDAAALRERALQCGGESAGANVFGQRDTIRNDDETPGTFPAFLAGNCTDIRMQETGDRGVGSVWRVVRHRVGTRLRAIDIAGFDTKRVAVCCVDHHPLPGKFNDAACVALRYQSQGACQT